MCKCVCVCVRVRISGTTDYFARGSSHPSKGEAEMFVRACVCVCACVLEYLAQLIILQEVRPFRLSFRLSDYFSDAGRSSNFSQREQTTAKNKQS